VQDIQSLELYYSQVRKIKFDDNVEVNDLNDIYNNLFTLPDKENLPTYFMKGKEQCSSHRARSIDDFIKISKKYFPELTVKDIFKFLISKDEEWAKDGKMMILGYCPNIRKHNYRGIRNTSCYYNTTNNYNLRDLSPMLNITVKELLTE